MSDKQGNGVCMFVYNNDQLDYTKFAILAAQYAKKSMNNISVTAITDDGTLGWMQQSVGDEVIDRCFDNVVIDNVTHDTNMRKHMDSPWTEFNAQFSNSNKHEVHTLTPYERTLLIDTDYLLMNNDFAYLFDSDINVGMHRYAVYIGGDAPYRNEVSLNDAGINHWWSTVVYFDQSDESKMFFDIWSHVKDNWEYYSLLYQFPKQLFRTDFCVSIAAHMMNGMNNGDTIHDFCNWPLINMDQKDDIAKVNNYDDVVFIKHDRKEQWKNILVRHQKQNLHIMNKRALDRHYDEFLTKMDQHV